jgi:hypothetical protein
MDEQASDLMLRTGAGTLFWPVAGPTAETHGARSVEHISMIISQDVEPSIVVQADDEPSSHRVVRENLRAHFCLMATR